MVKKLSNEIWIPLHKGNSKRNKSEDATYFCALLRKDAATEALERDLMVCGGGPTFITTHDGREPVSTYRKRSVKEFEVL